MISVNFVLRNDFLKKMFLMKFNSSILGTDQEDVEAAWVLVGGQASLSCHVRPEENPQEQLATVLWYRGTQGEPIFT